MRMHRSKANPPVQADEATELRLVVHPDANIGMVQMGLLQSWYSDRMTSARVTVPAVVTVPAPAASMISSIFCFPHVTRLSVSFDSQRALHQTIFCAISELQGLRECSISGGGMPREGVSLEVLSSLRKLERLSLFPTGHDGLCDHHVAGLSHMSASVKTLAFRGSDDGLSDDGLVSLSALRGLTELKVSLGLQVTRGGVQRLLASLPGLASLSVGLRQVGQVSVVRDVSSLSSLSIAVDDPGARLLEWSSLLTTCTLCVSSCLVSLRLGLLSTNDADFMIALGSLVHLTELKLGVQPASPATPYFSCDLLALTSLQQLQRLEFSCSPWVGLPFTPRVVSLAALAWPRLHTLALGVMGGRELVPEALELLDSLSNLRSLSLVAPLASSAAAKVQPGQCVPINLKYLPRDLLHLRLERAEVSAAPACTQLPALSSFSLHHGHADDRTLMHLVTGMPSLRSLDLNCVEDLTEPGLLAVLACLTKLERLTVAGSAWSANGRPPPPQGRRLSKLAAALTASAQSLQQLVWQPAWGSLSEEQLMQGARALFDLRCLRFLCISSGVPCSLEDQQTLAAALQKLQLGLPNSVLPLCTMTTQCNVSYDIFNDVQVQHIGGA
ncbi:hypothetical protein FOA52_004272 [Chlamydomonas sp. UWO 241]|nr:hypothetical protein FOA52_004272 [Chlamydomonas sp. UWO 241]